MNVCNNNETGVHIILDISFDVHLANFPTWLFPFILAFHGPFVAQLVSLKESFSISSYSLPPEHHKVNANEVVLAPSIWVFSNLYQRCVDP